MKKVLIDDVRIGILDNNGKFRMSPLMQNIKTYFQFMQSGNVFESQIDFYEIKDRKNDILVNIFDLNGKEYIVQSFSDDYLEYLNKIYYTLTKLMSCYEQKEKGNFIGCRISDLSIITKIDGNEVFMAPIEGFKLCGIGSITGHKYLICKTSKIVGINPDTCTLTSKRSIYKILSLSTEYKNYLEDIIFELELVLKRYSR